MKAVVKYAPGPGNIDVIDVDEPACGPQHAKVEIAFCGVCGTDLHVLHDTFRNYPPVILGHECAGTVVEIGPRVTGVSLGDRVTILGATAVTCGQCLYCRSGHFIFCKTRRGMGHGVNGGFTRYVVARPDQLYRVPAAFTLEEAALSEPFAAAVQAVREVTRVRSGETVLISGPGPIGLLCLKLLVAGGADAADGVKTIVAGAAGDDERLNAARRMGAAVAVDTSAGDLHAIIMEETDGLGVDVAFECSGHPASVRACLESLRPMGRHTQVGICGRDIQFPIDQIFYKQLTVAGSICYTAATWQRMMEIYAEGKVRLQDLVTANLPITEWRAAFDLCRDRKALKVVLHPV